jgi:hypothetical protein
VGPQASAGNNPVPYAVFGTSQVSLKITGSNFGPGSGASLTVYFGSQAIPPGNVNVVDSKTMFLRLDLSSGVILNELLAHGSYGTFNIWIGGAPPYDSIRSNSKPFYILPPTPGNLSVSPSATYARYEINSPGELITLKGFGFIPGARILFDGVTALNGIEIDTAFVDSTTLSAYLPPQALRYAGLYILHVLNGGTPPLISGEAVVFQVNNLVPTISQIQPGTLNIVPGPFLSANLTVTGSNFHPPSTSPTADDPGTFAVITGPNIATPVVPVVTFVSSSQLVLTIKPVTLLATPPLPAGTYTLTISNSAPGGGTATGTITVTSSGAAGNVPTISSLSPASVKAGSASFNLTVSGTNFLPGAWVNFYTSRLVPVATPTSTSITVSVPNYLITSPGTVPITVTNPGSGGTDTGGTSTRLFFDVTP